MSSEYFVNLIVDHSPGQFTLAILTQRTEFVRLTTKLHIMKYLLTFFFISQFIFSSVAQVTETYDSPWKTLEEGNELFISTNNGEIGRISISFQNMLDKESIVYWTQYVGENERPENEIGPRKYRTTMLSPKITDENEPVRTDKKEIVLNTDKADKIIVKVEKGKIQIQIKEEN